MFLYECINNTKESLEVKRHLLASNVHADAL